MTERGFEVEQPGTPADLPPPPGMGLSQSASAHWDDSSPRSPGSPPTGPDVARDPWAPLGGRIFYGLAAAMSAALLCMLYNPYFGRKGRFWFWDALRDAEGGLTPDWTLETATVVVLVALTLAYLTAALLPRTRGRGVWGLAWVALAFAAFAESGDDLGFLLTFVTIGLGIGALVSAGRDRLERSSRGLMCVAIGLMLAGLFMPFAPDADRHDTAREGYDCPAFEVVRGYVHSDKYRGPDDDRSYLEYAWVRFRAWLPQHIAAFVVVLLLLRLVGVRGAWLPITGNVLLIVFVTMMAWTIYQSGVHWGGPTGSDWPDWWSGLHELGIQWQARFVPHLFALVAALGDVRRR